MSLHLQDDWQRCVGQYVEIRLGGRLVRTGTVEAVMPDDSFLWLAAEGTDSRKMLSKADGYQVFTRYAWNYGASADAASAEVASAASPR